MKRASRSGRASIEFATSDHTCRSGLVFGGLWIALFLLTFLVSGPWTGLHAALFGAVAVLMMWRPAPLPVPWLAWSLAALCLIAASAAMLPARWFPTPEWRLALEALGVPTGDRVAIQTRMALESLAILAVTGFVGLWMAGHRAQSGQLRLWALAFTVGVAAYALAARAVQGSPLFDGLAIGGGHFGFYPNRNHTATYLAMGAVCGLGCGLQALRDKRFGMLAVALVATTVCMWAVAAWSISRAGVILTVAGGVVWVLLIGRRYLGRHGLWAVALVALAATGMFLVSETRARDRLSDTLDRAGTRLASDADAPLSLEPVAIDQDAPLDFRIPVFRDTLELIRDFPLTGVGANQFEFVFPQYRQETITANAQVCLHPESDWLWMAAETGLPATLALATLVVAACFVSIRGIRRGRDRALRAACLVAAMLVPAHGLFDVPGHRITLAWFAVWLFVLSLHPPDAAATITGARPRAWAGRLCAVVLLALAVMLARAEWFGGPQSAVPMAEIALKKAKALHRLDLHLEKVASNDGREYEPEPDDDLLLKALDIMKPALETTPLHRGLRHFSGFLALHFDDQYDRAETHFNIERALSPSWVGAPLSQAEAWSEIRPETSRQLWEIAMERARRLDSFSPNHPWGSQAAHRHIMRHAQKRPQLTPYLPDPPAPANESR